MGYPVIKVRTQSLNTKCTRHREEVHSLYGTVKPVYSDMPGREHVFWTRQGVGLHSTKTLKLDKGNEN